LGDPTCMRLVSVSQMVESAVRLLEPPGERRVTITTPPQTPASGAATGCSAGCRTRPES
jgi:hypothetical protein